MFFQACRLLSRASPVECLAIGPEIAPTPLVQTPTHVTEIRQDPHQPSLSPGRDLHSHHGTPHPTSSREHCPKQATRELPRQGLLIPPVPAPPQHCQRHSKDNIRNKFDDVLRVHCFPEKASLQSDNLPVKGRLKQHVQFWRDIGSPDMILSIIEQGYVIPFEEEPPPMFFRNNKSALREAKFVTDSILDLLASSRISEKSHPIREQSFICEVFLI